MKIKALSRSLDEHAPAKFGDAVPQFRNLDPALHPFEKPREYTRALNAAKLDRLFAKPFVAAMDGHIDGVYALARDPESLHFMASGSGDGEIRLWDLSQQSLVHSYPQAHKGIIQSMCISRASQNAARRLLSCSTDRTIKLWDADPRPTRSRFAGEGDDARLEPMPQDEQEATSSRNGLLGRGSSQRSSHDRHSEPLSVWNSKVAFNSLSHHASRPHFASSSSAIQIWDVSRGQSSVASSSTAASALRTMTWGPDSINVVRFNPSETEVLASAGSDRSVVLYDLRSGKPLTKMMMKMRANDIAWSPIEPTTFAVANEDHNLYTFDMRNLSSAMQIYKDHVAAAMSVEFSPTGQDLVSGSYDRTIRLWNVGEGAHSRDVYHTKRMQRIFSTTFTLDARFVISGSDDGNVRIWKTRASEKLGSMTGRERNDREYKERLRDKWRATGDIRKIERQRHVPKPVKDAQKLKRTMLDAQRTKDDRRRKHTEKGEERPKAARKDF